MYFAEEFCGFRGKAPVIYLAQPNGLGLESRTNVRAKGPAICEQDELW